jgi:MoxR-like ATPase
MAIINKLRLEQYLKLNYNVLFSGRHGVGKTEVIKSVFEGAGLRWKSGCSQ